MKKKKLWRFVGCLSFILLMVLCIGFPCRAGEPEIQKSERDGEIVFLLDTSSSMNRQDSGRYVADAIRQAVYGLPSGYQAGLVAYNTDIQAVVAPGTDMGPMEAALAGIEYTGYTNAGEGLMEAERLFSENDGVGKYIIMISDGEIDMPDGAAKEKSLEMYREAAMRAGERGIRIFIVAIGSEISQGMHIFDGAELTDGAIYWEGQSGSVSQIMERIVTEKLPVPMQELGVTDAGGGGIHAVLPGDAAHVRIIVTCDTDITEVTAEYQAEKGRTITGMRFAVLDMERPSGGAADIRFRTEDISGVRAYMLTEYRAAACVEAAYRIEEAERTEEEREKGVNPAYIHFADITLWLEDAEGEHNNLWLREDMEGREIPYTLNGASCTGIIEDGKIETSVSADGIDRIEVAVDMGGQPCLYDMGEPAVAVIEKYPDPSPEPPPSPDYRPLYAVLAFLAVFVLAVALWWIKKKNATVIYMAPFPREADKRLETKGCAYSGRLAMYVVRTRDGRDIPPQSYRLFGRGGGRLTLDRILTDCGIKFGKIGAEDIIFYPGPGHNLILMDQSERCTVMRGLEIMKKGMGYPVSYHEKITVTFEDEMTEMEIHYKNLKPDEREALK